MLFKEKNFIKKTGINNPTLYIVIVIWRGYGKSKASSHMSNTKPEKVENILTFKDDYKTLI